MGPAGFADRVASSSDASTEPRRPVIDAEPNGVPNAAAAVPRRRKAADGERTRLTPDAWIDAATEVLVDQGIDHVRVDVLAGQLGVTRGSFYWHFRDRDDLLRRVLQAWRDRATVQLTQRLAQAHTDPREQLRNVISLPFRGRAASKAARIELAIRAWARRDAMAREALEEADNARLAYQSRLLQALGFAPPEADMRAFALYSFEIAASLVPRQGSADHQAARRDFIERLILQPLSAQRTV